MYDLRVVGTSCSKPDAPDKATGRTRYAGDIALPGMALAGVYPPGMKLFYGPGRFL